MHRKSRSKTGGNAQCLKRVVQVEETNFGRKETGKKYIKVSLNMATYVCARHMHVFPLNGNVMDTTGYGVCNMLSSSKECV